MNVIRNNVIRQVLECRSQVSLYCDFFVLTNSPEFWKASPLPPLPTKGVMCSCIMQLCKITLTLIFLNGTFVVCRDP